MVYGFFLIGSLLVGAVYWIFTTCGGEATPELMWSPASGLIEPEPWLQSADGGYAGWSPGSSAYAGWSPGAYLNLFGSTTIYVPTTTTTTSTTTRRTIRPWHLKPDIPDSDAPKSPSSITPSDSDEESEKYLSDRLPPQLYPDDQESDVQKEPGGAQQGPGAQLPPEVPVIEMPTTEPSDIDAEYAVEWRSRDVNEEAYEESPQDLSKVKTRPPDKLPVEGWGYDYDN